MSTVILGTGIIGVSTAYYLSLLSANHQIYLIDSSPVPFHSASSFAGGFLAADWFSPASSSLGALSFKLHRQLAAEFDGSSKWGYAGSRSLSLVVGDEESEETSSNDGTGDAWIQVGGSRADASANAKAGAVEKEANSGPSWLTPQTGQRLDFVSDEKTSAQIDPARLCKFLLSECQKRGVKFIYPARAVNVTTSSTTKTVTSVTIQHSTTDSEETIPCSNLVFTAGAWTSQVFETVFPKSPLNPLPITSLAGHSYLLSTPRLSSPDTTTALTSPICDAIWTTYPPTAGFSTEIFSRLTPDNTLELWIGGLNSSAAELPLPALATDAKTVTSSLEHLKEIADLFLGEKAKDVNSDDLQIVRESVCFRPVVEGRVDAIVDRIEWRDLGIQESAEDGSKSVNEIQEEGRGGVFIAAGHGPWGISQSLGTGTVVAEMILGKEKGALSADISGLGLASVKSA